MIVYSIAKSAEELDELYQLRFRVLCLEQKLEPEESYPSGREKDRFDAYAIHAIARHFDLITVGTARLVPVTPLGLPLERVWTLHHQSTGKVAELSKLTISRLAVGVSGAGNREVVMGLLRTLYQESRVRGYHQWYIQLTEGMKRLLGKYGLPLTLVGHAPSPMDASLYRIEIRHLESSFAPSRTTPAAPNLRRNNVRNAIGSPIVTS